MRYSVLGGAFQVSVPDRRGSIGSRPWLVRAAADCASAPARWLSSGAGRKSILVVVLGATAIGAGAGTRALQQRAARVGPRAAADAAATVPASDIPSVRWGYTPTRPAAAPAAGTAERTLSALEQPGYALSASASQALDSVRLTVADAAVMQQLRTQIQAPAIPSTLSGPALAQLIALVQQSQVASAAAGQSASAAGQGAAVVDPVQLAQAQTAVRAAQQDLAAATKARDGATSPAPGTATSTAAATAPAATASATAAATSAPTASPASPALAAAMTRLLNANQHLSELLSVPSAATLAAAQQAVQDALNATPQAPSAQQMAAAQAAVTQAQKSYDTAAQGPNQRAVAAAPPAAAIRAAPSVSGAQHGAVPAQNPVAKAGEKPDDTLNPVAVAPDSQQLAELQANIDSAKAALATLQQAAAYAADPESQPSLIQARKALAALTAPPDPGAVAAAQADVVAAQQAVAALQASSPPVAAMAVAAATAPAAAVTVVVPVAATPAGTTVVPRTVAPGSAADAASPTDPVALAEQHLTDAQKQLAALVAGNSGTTALPAGSTTTPLTPDLLAAQNQVAAGAVSQPQLTAIEIELRARYVSDAVLSTAHLHPSALTQPVTTPLPAATGTVARPLAWPVVGPITQPFGVPELGVGAPHTGIDIGVPVGTPVLAAAPGVVTFAGGDPATGYGYYAIIDHGGGVSTLYGHLALPPLLHAGQFLPQGGLIGLSGSTGFSTGPHVHFEVRLNGTPVDPLNVLQAANPH